MIDAADVRAYLEDAARGKNAWWSYLAAIVVAMVFAAILQISLDSWLRALHVQPPDSLDESYLQAHPIALLRAAGITGVILVVAFGFAIWLFHKKTFSDIVGHWSWGRFWWAAAVWSMVLIASTLIDFAAAPHAFRISASGATATLAAVAVLTIPAQAFSEEFVFRGYLTQGLMLATKSPIAAALISGLLFGLLHIPNSIPSAVDATLLGIAASLIAIRTRGIALPFGLHLVNNLFAAVFVVSAQDVFKGMPGLITFSAPQLIWFDVGVDTVALVLIAWLVLRRRVPSAA